MGAGNFNAALSAFIALVIALVTLATAVLVFMQNRQQKKKIEEVHVLVNSRLEEVVKRVGVLTDLLESKGIEIPPRSDSGP